MPNASLEDALKEVYAMAPTDRVPLATIQLSHPSLVDSIFMVQDRVAHDFTLEDDSVETFEPVPFRFIPPSAGENGLQELTLAIDNVDRRVSDFIDGITGGGNQPVEVTYRPYLADDPATVQLNPPLLLFLTDVEINAFEVKGRATFTNIVNMKFPTEYYERARFPGLGG